MKFRSIDAIQEQHLFCIFNYRIFELKHFENESDLQNSLKGRLFNIGLQSKVFIIRALILSQI